jgi:hypothetical protein
LSLLAAAGGPANVASHELAIPRRDMLRRVPPLHDPNTDDFQSVRPAKLCLAAERAANTSAPCASHAPAGYKPAARTGQRPVFRV